MKKGWEISDYVNYVKLQLGGSLLELEIEKELPFIIEKMALGELKNYIKTNQLLPCQYAPIIDLTGKNVQNVNTVLRNRNNSMTVTGLDTNLFIYQTSGQYGLQQGAKEQMVYNLMINQLKNSLSTDMDFTYDKEHEKLYLYAQYPLPTNITIMYTPDIQDVSEIYTPYWMNFLRRLSVAYAKEALGRIRSKYTLNSASYTLDGDKLLAESAAELSQIRDELNHNVNLAHIIS